jgi:ubiquinone/menaquinone biosynthesis C-methylase UbiE
MTRGVLLGRDRELRDRAVASLRLRAGRQVLDLACGPGQNFRRLEERIGPSGRVVAFDHTDEMLRRARETALRNGWMNVSTVQGDAARLPLESGSLGAALCTLAISVMPDPLAAIREVHRCLEPGARFAVVDVKELEGRWQLLNPLVVAVFVPTTEWNVGFDVVAAMRDVFGNVSGIKLNRGSAFLAVSRKCEPE